MVGLASRSQDFQKAGFAYNIILDFEPFLGAFWGRSFHFSRLLEGKSQQTAAWFANP